MCSISVVGAFLLLTYFLVFPLHPSLLPYFPAPCFLYLLLCSECAKECTSGHMGVFPSFSHFRD